MFNQPIVSAKGVTICRTGSLVDRPRGRRIMGFVANVVVAGNEMQLGRQRGENAVRLVRRVGIGRHMRQGVNDVA